MGTNKSDVEQGLGQLNTSKHSESDSNTRPPSPDNSIDSLSDTSSHTQVEPYKRPDTPDSEGTQIADYNRSKDAPMADKTVQARFQKKLKQQVVENSKRKAKKIFKFLGQDEIQRELFVLSHFKKSMYPDERELFLQHSEQNQDLKLEGIGFNTFINHLLFTPIIDQVMLREHKSTQSIDEMFNTIGNPSYITELMQEQMYSSIEAKAFKKLIILNTFIDQNLEEIEGAMVALNGLMNHKQLDEKFFMYQIINTLISKINQGENILQANKAQIDSYIDANKIAKVIIGIENNALQPKKINVQLCKDIIGDITPKNIVENKERIIHALKGGDWFREGQIWSTDNNYAEELMNFFNLLNESTQKTDLSLPLKSLKTRYFLDNTPAFSALLKQTKTNDKANSPFEIFLTSLHLENKSKEEIDNLTSKINTLLGQAETYQEELEKPIAERAMKLGEAFNKRFAQADITPPFSELYQACNKDKTLGKSTNHHEILIRKEISDLILQSVMKQFSNVSKKPSMDPRTIFGKKETSQAKHKHAANTILQLISNDSSVAHDNIGENFYEKNPLAATYRPIIERLVAASSNNDLIFRLLREIKHKETFKADSRSFGKLSGPSLIEFDIESHLSPICHTMDKNQTDTTEIEERLRLGLREQIERYILTSFSKEQQQMIKNLDAIGVSFETLLWQSELDSSPIKTSQDIALEIERLNQLQIDGAFTYLNNADLPAGLIAQKHGSETVEKINELLRVLEEKGIDIKSISFYKEFIQKVLNQSDAGVSKLNEYIQYMDKVNETISHHPFAHGLAALDETTGSEMRVELLKQLFEKTNGRQSNSSIHLSMYLAIMYKKTNTEEKITELDKKFRQATADYIKQNFKADDIKRINEKNLSIFSKLPYKNDLASMQTEVENISKIIQNGTYDKFIKIGLDPSYLIDEFTSECVQNIDNLLNTLAEKGIDIYSKAFKETIVQTFKDNPLDDGGCIKLCCDEIDRISTLVHSVELFKNLGEINPQIESYLQMTLISNLFDININNEGLIAGFNGWAKNASKDNLLAKSLIKFRKSLVIRKSKTLGIFLSQEDLQEQIDEIDAILNKFQFTFKPLSQLSETPIGEIDEVLLSDPQTLTSLLITIDDCSALNPAERNKFMSRIPEAQRAHLSVPQDIFSPVSESPILNFLKNSFIKAFVYVFTFQFITRWFNKPSKQSTSADHELELINRESHRLMNKEMNEVVDKVEKTAKEINELNTIEKNIKDVKDIIKLSMFRLMKNRDNNPTVLATIHSLQSLMENEKELTESAMLLSLSSVNFLEHFSVEDDSNYDFIPNIIQQTRNLLTHTDRNDKKTLIAINTIIDTEVSKPSMQDVEKVVDNTLRLQQDTNKAMAAYIDIQKTNVSLAAIKQLISQVSPNMSDYLNGKISNLFFSCKDKFFEAFPSNEDIENYQENLETIIQLAQSKIEAFEQSGSSKDLIEDINTMLEKFINDNSPQLK